MHMWKHNTSHQDQCANKSVSSILNGNLITRRISALSRRLSELIEFCHVISLPFLVSLPRGIYTTGHNILGHFSAKRGGGGEGEKCEGGEKGREVTYLLSPVPLPFSLPPYPLPLSTPAMQAKDTWGNKARRRTLLNELIFYPLRMLL